MKNKIEIDQELLEMLFEMAWDSYAERMTWMSMNYPHHVTDIKKMSEILEQTRKILRTPERIDATKRGAQ